MFVENEAFLTQLIRKKEIETERSRKLLGAYTSGRTGVEYFKIFYHSTKFPQNQYVTPHMVPF